MKKKINIASISDIHLGHHNTPTVDILNNLRIAFPDSEETGKLDIIWFGGDIFDRAIYLHDPNLTEIKIWIYQFLRMCKKRDISIRILEGTPSHDWHQSRLFKEINENGEINADLVYFDTLCIERNNKLGISVLYVPDEWAVETDDTWKQVSQLLKTNSLDKVDFSIMHGSFDYQLPSHVKVPVHIPQRYLDITKGFIFIGHIHKSSTYERILANGSFDRLSHGEEEPKGHWRVNYSLDGNHLIRFVENTNAKIYKTIDCSTLDISNALEKLSIVKELPEGSFVRIKSKKDDVILTNIDLLRKQYPTLRWSSKVSDDKENQSSLLVDLRDSFYQVNITRENIVELTLERIKNLTNDPLIHKECSRRLMELIA